MKELNRVKSLEFNNFYGFSGKVNFAGSLSEITESKRDIRSGDSSVTGLYSQENQPSYIIQKAFVLLKYCFNRFYYNDVNFTQSLYLPDDIAKNIYGLQTNTILKFTIIINGIKNILTIRVCESGPYKILKLIVNKNKLFSKMSKEERGAIYNCMRIIHVEDEDNGLKDVGIKHVFQAVYRGDIIVLSNIEPYASEFEIVKYLQFIQQHGCGQLIFSANNTRFLEILEDYNFRFETINKQNKFIKITKRGNSNLRDVYLRALKLGGLKERLIEKDWDPIDLTVEFDK